MLIRKDECSRFKLNTKLVDGPANGSDLYQYLKEAFEKHGPPLILKHDGGSIFHEDEVEKLLAEHQVISGATHPTTGKWNVRFGT